jgi:hypothetical protein
VAERRSWLLAFAGFFLLLSAWAVAAPYAGFPDERDHILRAYGVATGQVVLEPATAANGGGAYVDAPRSLLVPRCWQFRADRPASCAREPGGDETVVQAPTAAGRYFPLYYALVGAPLALSPNWIGVLLARLISAAICAALLATAFSDAVRWIRRRLLLVGLVLAATPMVAHMGGAVNPSGVELAAGIAFFAAALPLLFNPAARHNRTLLWHVGVAALALATLRMLGPVWLGLSVLALLLPLRRATLADLWRWRALRIWIVAVIGSAIAAVIWAFALKATEPNTYFNKEEVPLSALGIAWVEVQRWPTYIQEMIGILSWLDALMPGVVYVAWTALAGAVVVWGFLLGDRDGRLRLLTLGAAGVLVPTAISIVYANTFGFITQGRYLLPLLVGLPLLASMIISQSNLPADVGRRLVRFYAVVLLPTHFVALAFTMIRWQQGVGEDTSLNPLVGTWHPVLGSGTPLVACLAGIAILMWLYWTMVGRAAASPDLTDAPVTTPGATLTTPGAALTTTGATLTATDGALGTTSTPLGTANGAAETPQSPAPTNPTAHTSAAGSPPIGSPDAPPPTP